MLLLLLLLLLLFSWRWRMMRTRIHHYPWGQATSHSIAPRCNTTSRRRMSIRGMANGAVGTLPTLHAVNAQWIVDATASARSQIAARVRCVNRIWFVDHIVNAVNALRTTGAVGQWRRRWARKIGARGRHGDRSFLSRGRARSESFFQRIKRLLFLGPHGI